MPTIQDIRPPQVARKKPHVLRRLLSHKKYRILAIAAAGLMVAVGGYYGYSRYQYNRQPDHVKLIKALEAHMILPEGEEPVIASVEDPDKLQAQAFLAQGKTGDRLLIYYKSKKVVLYRPSVDKIVDIGPLSIIDLSEGQQAP